MRETLLDGEFSEILVEGYQDALLGMRRSQDGNVTRILGPGTRPDDVVAESGESRRSPASYTGIEQEGGHQDASAVGNNSIRSWRASSEA